MSRAQRTALLGAAVVVLLAVFLLTRGDDTPSSAPAPVAAAPATTTAASTTSTTPAPATTQKPKQRRPDPGPLLTSAKVTKITTSVGKTVRFRARSADGDEVHVHGFDRSFDAPAGKTVSIAFPATMSGIFEIELEASGTEIGTLEVRE